MKLTDSQLVAAKKCRLRWGCFYLAGPNDRLPTGFLMDQFRVASRRMAKIEEDALARIKAELT